MALTQRKLSKSKQIRLAVSLIAVIGITLGVAYYGMFKKPKPADESEFIYTAVIKDSVNSAPETSGFKSIEDLGGNPLFKKLEQFGTWPLSINPKGREQPFIEKRE
ncbi:hypothetical protein KKF64_02540 [Patescibacteria group bacterium]|nr:hypothetical protein [Patescibacteria group bacterium]